MAGKSPDSSFDAPPDLKSRVLGEMRNQGIETSIRELVQESYEVALGNLGSPLLSRAERRRLRQLVQNDLLGGMVVKD
jgi:hypothetical protein